MLYIGTATEIPLGSSSDLRVESLEEARQPVGRWFSQPAVRFLGSHTGCSCGFPSVIAETPVEYYEGMPLESDDRAADLRSVRALLQLLEQVMTSRAPVELYPVADGDEAKPPKGVVEWRLDSLNPEQFFFNEGFMHLVYHR